MSERQTDAGSDKATIEVLDRNREVTERFTVPFNPTKYDIESSVQYAEQDVPGYTSPVVQFASGRADTLSMELFFDRYEAGADVRQDTAKIESLLELDPGRKAPPVVRVAWAELQFTGVLESANTTYTLFLSDGTPARARTNVSFTEYTTPQKEEREIDEAADEARVHVVTEGETLWGISDAEYGDPTKWRTIADANDIDNPRTLQPGTELIIPQTGQSTTTSRQVRRGSR